MIIKKDTPCLFIRLGDYNKNDFLEEHLKTLKEKGEVWLLKMGKPVKENFIKYVAEQKGGLILKSTSKHGNKFYYCIFEPDDFMDKKIFPDYYNDIFNDNYYFKSNLSELETWFKIKKIIYLNNEQVEKFKTISTDRSLYECGLKYHQVSQMHVKASCDINI